jgi:hypothetical protein
MRPEQAPGQVPLRQQQSVVARVCRQPPVRFHEALLLVSVPTRLGSTAPPTQIPTVVGEHAQKLPFREQKDQLATVSSPFFSLGSMRHFGKDAVHKLSRPTTRTTRDPDQIQRGRRVGCTSQAFQTGGTMQGTTAGTSDEDLDDVGDRLPGCHDPDNVVEKDPEVDVDPRFPSHRPAPF